MDITVPLTFAVDGVALLVTAISAYYVYRQQGSPYRYLSGLLLLDHACFIGVILLELLRVVAPTPPVLVDSTLLAVGLILASVMVLGLAALVIYYRPTEGGFLDFLRQRFAARSLVGLGSMVLAGYMIGIYLYFVIDTAFSVVHVTSIFGGTVATTALSPIFLDLLFGVLVLFAVNPMVLLLLAKNKVKEPQTRDALTALPLAWAAIGVSILLFRGLLTNLGVEATSIGWLSAAVAFGITASVYRRASLLASFFEPLDLKENLALGAPFTERLGIPDLTFQRRDVLLEISSSINYEQVVKDFAIEAMGKGDLVFVFTSKTSPVYRALAVEPEIRFYTMTTRVSYPTQPQAGRTHEILVPQNDQAVLLDLLDRTVKSRGEYGIAIIFDNITDLILNFKFELAYKFLKIANEIIYDSGSTSLFIVTRGVHDAKMMKLLESLFQNHMAYDGTGLQLKRRAQSLPVVPKERKVSGA